MSFITCYSILFKTPTEKLCKAIPSTSLSPSMRENWWTYLSMIVEPMLLSDLVGSLRSAGHVNGKLIRIDRHWSRSRSRFGSRTSQQRAHNQQRHPEDHVVDGEWWRRRVLRLSRTVFPTLKGARRRDRRVSDKKIRVTHNEFTRYVAIARNRGRLLASRSQCSMELASLTSGFATHFSRGNAIRNDRSEGHVADGWSRVATRTRRHCAANFARRRRRRCRRRRWRDVGPGGLVLPCNTKARKTAGYGVQCAFASRARSRKDAVGILAGASVVILIVTEGEGVSFFLLLDVRVADLHYNVLPWACTRPRKCLQTSFLFRLLAHSFLCSSSSLFLVSRMRRKRIERERKWDRELMARII